MIAYVFPGQASQFVGMGKQLDQEDEETAFYINQANSVLEFDIYEIMCNGTADDLVRTDVTQPAVFIHSTIKYLTKRRSVPTAVAGHSLGEISALVANETLTFADGLRLVKARAEAMQRACEQIPGTMAAVVGLEDEEVETACKETPGIVVAANYNCPGQLVISGEIDSVKNAGDACSSMGARMVIPLEVGGAFHSPLMEPAQNELAHAIKETPFENPICPIYQNVNGKACKSPNEIQENLMKQLTSPVRWSVSIFNMLEAGIEEFVEVGGKGKVLQGMIKRIDRRVPITMW